MIDIGILKNIAKNKFIQKVETEEELIDLLKNWWSNKYKQPDNHPLFLAKTIEEHVIDFFLDKFRADPKSANYLTEEQIRIEDAKLKEKMGDDWTEEYSYLQPPTERELRGSQSENMPPDIIEEDFTDVRTVMDDGK